MAAKSGTGSVRISMAVVLLITTHLLTTSEIICTNCLRLWRAFAKVSSGTCKRSGEVAVDTGATQPHDPLRAARELLGVTADAVPAQLARAYRRQARRLHPDISREPDATERFWALQAAYHLALDAAPADPPTTQATTPATTPVPAQAQPATEATALRVQHRDTPIVLGAAMADYLLASEHGYRGPDQWLLAGPVRVQPLHHPSTTDASTSRGGPHGDRS